MSASDFRTCWLLGERQIEPRHASVIDGQWFRFVAGEGIRIALAVRDSLAHAELETDLSGLTSATLALTNPSDGTLLYSHAVSVPPVSSLTMAQFRAGLGWHAAWEIPVTAWPFDFLGGQASVAVDCYGLNAGGRVWFARGSFGVLQSRPVDVGTPIPPAPTYVTADQLAAALAGLNLPVIYPSLAALQTAAGPGRFWDANYLYERP